MSEISPRRPTGCRAASCAYASTGYIGVLIVPGATAFTRMPRLAYSIASDLVAAFRPPFVNTASTGGYAGDGVVDEARCDLYDMAAALLLHLLILVNQDVVEIRPHLCGDAGQLHGLAPGFWSSVMVFDIWGCGP